MDKKEEIQLIGLDIGRGFSKGYTVFNGEEKSVVAQSCYSILLKPFGKNKSTYDSYDFIDMELNDIFGIGEKCLYGPNVKSDSDNKVSYAVETMIKGLLAKLAMVEKVAISIGVPNSAYKDDEEISKIEKFYTGKKYTLEFEGKVKKIEIIGCYCFREADAVSWLPEVDSFIGDTGNFGIVSIGYRTIEKSYYKNSEFVEANSESSEGGNINHLKALQNSLNEGYTEDLYALDTSDDPEHIRLLDKLYSIDKREIVNISTYTWLDRNKLKIVLTGGLVERMKLTADDVDKNYYIVKDPVIASAKGLYTFLKIASTNEKN